MGNLTRAMMMGAAGASGDKVYVDDVFSTFLYEGTNTSTKTINNGIDLSGEGGLVWIKGRDRSINHYLFDTERPLKFLKSNSTDQQFDAAASSYINSYTSTGFVTGDAGNIGWSGDYASWTFRKAPGFFDVVTWTGTAATRTIPHSLGSVPGMIIAKRTDGAGQWYVYHRELANTQYIMLNSSNGEDTGAIWGNTTPTSTEFTVGTGQPNEGNQNYVAYIFAHDDASFGTGGDESIVKCGSFTIDGSGKIPTTNLGFEPQWILTKRKDSTGQWIIYDNMRGIATGGNDSILYPNLANAEDATANTLDLTSTGFTGGADGYYSGSGTTYIYMAIRRPHKPPEAATDVFDALIYTGTGAQRDISFSPAYADLIWNKNRLWLTGHNLTDRLRGEISRLQTNENYASTYNAQAAPSFDSQGLFSIGTNSETNNANPGYNSFVTWIFKRAPGFFDVVAYTGTGSATTINHNLGAVPSVVLIKGTNTTYNWYWQHYALGANTWMQLNNQEAGAGNGNIFNNTLPTSSVFSLGSLAGTNGSGNTYIAYLFGDLPGISKAGTYTGTGSNINVDCGFTAGARFVLIKRKDGSGNVGDWYVWDTARGILSGNDPYLRPNVYEADVTNTDYVDPLSTGFTVTASAPAALNVSGGTYLFLAIA